MADTGTTAKELQRIKKQKEDLEWENQEVYNQLHDEQKKVTESNAQLQQRIGQHGKVIAENKTLESEIKKAQEQLGNLEKDNASLKRKISERDDKIKKTDLEMGNLKGELREVWDKYKVKVTELDQNLDTIDEYSSKYEEALLRLESADNYCIDVEAELANVRAEADRLKQLQDELESRFGNDNTPFTKMTVEEVVKQITDFVGAAAASRANSPDSTRSNIKVQKRGSIMRHKSLGAEMEDVESGSEAGGTDNEDDEANNSAEPTVTKDDLSSPGQEQLSSAEPTATDNNNTASTGPWPARERDITVKTQPATSTSEPTSAEVPATSSSESKPSIIEDIKTERVSNAPEQHASTESSSAVQHYLVGNCRHDTTELLSLMPMEAWVVFALVCLALLTAFSGLYRSERRLWWAVNDITRRAVVNMRDTALSMSNGRSSESMLGSLLTQAEHFIGVEKGLLG